MTLKTLHNLAPLLSVLYLHMVGTHPHALSDLDLSELCRPSSLPLHLCFFWSGPPHNPSRMELLNTKALPRYLALWLCLYTTVHLPHVLPFLCNWVVRSLRAIIDVYFSYHTPAAQSLKYCVVDIKQILLD